MKRKICVVTGTRAEFGLLRWVMNDIQNRDDLQLQIVATGSHLSKQHGETVNEITEAGFTIDYKVEMLLSSDTSTAVTKSIGLGLIGFADAFAVLEPDIVVLLGDRYEMLGAATAALIGNIPIAHLHGGEVTEGAIDDSIRNAITKMSHLHFVAHDEYRKRVIQMGEAPEHVFLVGGLGVDAIMHLQLVGRAELERSLGFKFGLKNLLITYHPVTLDLEQSYSECLTLLSALSTIEDTRLIFTLPNADTGNQQIRDKIIDFVSHSQNAVLFESMGQLRYLSCLQFVDGVIGNSSSGILEAPSMGIGTVNIGTRQRGRLFAASVLDCKPDVGEIQNAINMLYDPIFRKAVTLRSNPYGKGGASKKIVDELSAVTLDGITRKTFHPIET